MAVAVSEIAGGGLRFRIDWRQVEKLFKRFPASTAYEIRDAFGRMAGRFRRTLLDRHKGTAMRELVRRSIFYRVNPPNFKGSRGQDYAAVEAFHRRLKLDSIKFRFYSTSEVSSIHETGGTITGDLIVPIGLTRAEIEAARPGGRENRKRQILRRSKVRIGRMLYEVTGKGKGRTFVPRFALKSSVTIPPRLGFYRTWGELEPRFQGYLASALQRAARNSQRWVKAQDRR